MPFMMRGPGIPRGRVSGELVANVDLAPTIVQIAGARPDRRMDGRSLLPFARRPKLRSRRPILLESYPPKAGLTAVASGAGPLASIAKDPTPPNWRGIVYGNWKLARFAKQGFELYDLKRDPHELNSLARNPRFRPVLRFLRRQLKRLERCRGRSCRRQIGRPPKPRARS
jgi:arylsulfatase A-like enzyme